MAFDVGNLLANLFGGGPMMAPPTVPKASPQPQAIDTLTDSPAGAPFADWIR